MRVHRLFNIDTVKSRFTLVIAGDSPAYIARYWSLPFGLDGELLKRQWSSELQGTEMNRLIQAAQEEIELLDGPVRNVEESSFVRGIAQLAAEKATN